MYQISGMTEWRLVTIETGRTLNVTAYSSPPTLYDENTIEANLVGDGSKSDKVVYFATPEYYLGKLLETVAHTFSSF
jgi:hypothetical protein